jgi:hypothetical protein
MIAQTEMMARDFWETLPLGFRPAEGRIFPLYLFLDIFYLTAYYFIYMLCMWKALTRRTRRGKNAEAFLNRQRKTNPNNSIDFRQIL